MKIRLFTVASFLLLLSITCKAQDYKIGYMQEEKIFGQWPETTEAIDELNDFEIQLKSKMEAKTKEFQTKVESYQENMLAMDAMTRRDTETELTNLQTELEKFGNNLDETLSAKKFALLKPLRDKFNQTIEQVAKENGYTHIFAYGTSLLFSSDKSSDISVKVAQKLGFTLILYEDIP